MRLPGLSILAALSLSQTILAATSDQWRSRSIYQVLTDRFARTDGSTTATCNTADRLYCGGSWNGIINRLDYIQGMGFDAIWISPITTQIDGETGWGEAYHGYWQQNINSVNSHFGSASDLMSLATALHSRGMYLMVDIVVNHFGWNGGPTTVDYADFTPFSGPAQFHSYCKVDGLDTANMTQMEDCWMGDEVVALPDLRTEDADVALTWNTWITNMVSKYSIDGLRLDSAIGVNPSFWSKFIAAAKVYMVGEVFQAATALVCSYQDVLPGVMNFPTYFPLRDALTNTSGSMSGLADSINLVKSTCKDTGLLGSFSENHDLPRIATLNGDMALAQNVLAYTILADGIPIVYQGQEQHYNALGGENDPYNREALWFSNYNTDATLYKLAAKLNAARKNAISMDSTYLSYNNWPIWNDSNTLAMRKGQMVTVLSNKGSSSSSYTLSLPSTYPAGTVVTELLTCTQASVDSTGHLAVPMSGGTPAVYYPTANIGNQCSSSKRSSARRDSVPMGFNA